MTETKKNTVATTAIILAYMRPQDLLTVRIKQGIAYKVGDVLDFHDDKVGPNMQPHPQFGKIPLIRVTEMSENGRPYTGEFTCTYPECHETVEVHAGDFFQKRRCKPHQNRVGRLARKGIKSPEDAERIKAEREMKAAQDAAKRAEDKAKKAKEAAEKIRKAAEERATKAKADADKKLEAVKAVAKEKGAEVSKKAETTTVAA